MAADWAQSPPGPDTVGIFRPSEGKFYLNFENTAGFADVEFTYGNSDMLPVAGGFGVLPGGDPPPPGTPTTTTTTLSTTTTTTIDPGPGWNPGTCTFDGIPMWGRVQFVDFFADVTIEEVDFFPDLRVELVGSFSSSCGEWQIVDSFPAFTVEVVVFFPDLRIEYVDFFPGPG